MNLNGETFAQIFHQVYVHHSNFQNYCKKMQCLYNEYRNQLKSIDDNINFFTASYDRDTDKYKYFTTFSESLAYENFYLRFLLTNKSMHEVLEEVL